jgi:hypothetical protein
VINFLDLILNIFYYSLDTGRTNYNSIDSSPTSTTSTPIVFCIHGNKFGIARCCDDLVPGQDHVHGTGDGGGTLEDLVTGQDDQHHGSSSGNFVKKNRY